MVDSAQLGVDLETDVGHHLLAQLAPLVQAVLEDTLGGDVELQLAQVLDLVIEDAGLEGQDDDEQVQMLVQLDEVWWSSPFWCHLSESCGPCLSFRFKLDF